MGAELYWVILGEAAALKNSVGLLPGDWTVKWRISLERARDLDKYLSKVSDQRKNWGQLVAITGTAVSESDQEENWSPTPVYYVSN